MKHAQYACSPNPARYKDRDLSVFLFVSLFEVNLKVLYKLGKKGKNPPIFWTNEKTSRQDGLSESGRESSNDPPGTSGLASCAVWVHFPHIFTAQEPRQAFRDLHRVF